MRILRWTAGIVAGLILLAVLAVVIVVVFVDPNRFKGRIERMVQQATGQPFEIRGDLDIAWYPWLALKTGPAQLGTDPPLVQWEAARVGAQLIPLIRGRLIVSKVRLEGLQVHLRRDSAGRTNWNSLTAKPGTDPRPPPEIGGLEIRNGALDYWDAQSNKRVALSNWRLDVDAWQPGKPVAARTQFTIGPAQLSLLMNLNSMEPLQARGALSVETSSLRSLLSDLSIPGPRPLDPTALGVFTLTTQWTVNDSAISITPIALRLDQTHFSGSLNRTSSLWTFVLKGDRIALDRYTRIEDTSTKPFELPIAELKALPIQGVLSFDEAQLGGAHMKDVRLHAR